MYIYIGTHYTRSVDASCQNIVLLSCAERKFQCDVFRSCVSLDLPSFLCGSITIFNHTDKRPVIDSRLVYNRLPQSIVFESAESVVGLSCLLNSKR